MIPLFEIALSFLKQNNKKSTTKGSKKANAWPPKKTASYG